MPYKCPTVCDHKIGECPYDREADLAFRAAERAAERAERAKARAERDSERAKATERYMEFVREAAVPGTNPRFFRVGSLVVNAAEFAVATAIVFGAGEQEWREYYHRNNAVLIEAGQRLKEASNRARLWRGDGTDHVPEMDEDRLRAVTAAVLR